MGVWRPVVSGVEVGVGSVGIGVEEVEVVGDVRFCSRTEDLAASLRFCIAAVTARERYSIMLLAQMSVARKYT